MLLLKMWQLRKWDKVRLLAPCRRSGAAAATATNTIVLPRVLIIVVQLF